MTTAAGHDSPADPLAYVSAPLRREALCPVALSSELWPPLQCSGRGEICALAEASQEGEGPPMAVLACSAKACGGVSCALRWWFRTEGADKLIEVARAYNLSMMRPPAAARAAAAGMVGVGSGGGAGEVAEGEPAASDAPAAAAGETPVKADPTKARRRSTGRNNRGLRQAERIRGRAGGTSSGSGRGMTSSGGVGAVQKHEFAGRDAAARDVGDADRSTIARQQKAFLQRVLPQLRRAGIHIKPLTTILCVSNTKLYGTRGDSGESLLDELGLRVRLRRRDCGPQLNDRLLTLREEPCCGWQCLRGLARSPAVAALVMRWQHGDWARQEVVLQEAWCRGVARCDGEHARARTPAHHTGTPARHTNTHGHTMHASCSGRTPTTARGAHAAPLSLHCWARDGAVWLASGASSMPTVAGTIQCMV